MGAKVLSKYMKDSRTGLATHANLMKKVDRIIDKEIIEHFDLLNSDSEQ